MKEDDIWTTLSMDDKLKCKIALSCIAILEQPKQRTSDPHSIFNKTKQKFLVRLANFDLDFASYSPVFDLSSPPPTVFFKKT